MRHCLLITPKTQDAEYTCWASCTRMVFHWYRRAEITQTDTDLANGLGLDPTKFQDVQHALSQHGLYDGQDDRANLPTMAEIKESIFDRGQPLIACVTRNNVPFSRNPLGGHYVVIAGFDDTTDELCVMDPANGSEHWIPYDKQEYRAPYGRRYWGCTYYTKKP